MKALKLLLLLLVMPVAVQAQFNYTINNGAVTITGYTGSGGTVIVPATIEGIPVTSIGNSAFAVPMGGVPKINSVTIPSSVTSIGDYAFANSSIIQPLSYLGAVYFQGNAPSAGGASIFAGAPYATVYYLADTTGWGTNFGGAPATLWDPATHYAYSINNGTITISKYMGSGGDLVIPDTINGLPVTRIGERTFDMRSTLTSITIPNSIVSIGAYAFNGCSSITSMVIPNSITNIGDFASSSCTSLTSVTISTNLTRIAYGMFSYCDSLTSVMIPSSVTNLGQYAFASCTKLKGLYFWGNAPTISSYVFNEANEVTIYRLAGATGWGATFAGFPVAIWDVVYPAVISQPVGRTASPGSLVLFTVAVSGPGPMTYQWRVNGTNITSATNVICAINVQANSGGQYSVVVNNPWGTTVSSNAALIVNSSQAGILGGTVVAWDYFSKTAVPANLYNVVAIAAGANHALALRNDGGVTAWDNGDYGQKDVSLNNAVAIAAGWDHSVALRSDGTVVSWGGNYSVPAGLSNVVAVAAGGDHTLALLANGIVVAWGDNDNGQTTVPAGLSNVVAVAAGDVHSLALRADGTVVAWGRYFDHSSNLLPIYVPPGLQNVVTIAAGGNHALALQADGTVVAWGGDSVVPARLGAVMALAAGPYHCMALRADQTVIEWSAGIMTNTPANLSNVVAVAAGNSHSVALIAASSPNLPIITLQPIPVTIFSIGITTLTVNVTGPAPFAYQWYLGASGDISQPVAEATNASYITLPTTTNMTYWARVTNPYGSVDSRSVLVTVIKPSPSLAEATDNSLAWFTGGNTGYEFQKLLGPVPDAHDGEDAAYSGISGGSTAWHQAWMQTTVTGPGTLAFWWRLESDILIGTSQFSFYIDSSLQGQSATNWTQQTYRIAAGVHTIRWVNFIEYVARGKAFLDQVNFVPDVPQIATQPVSLSRVEGDSAIFNVTASGSAPLVYQWRKDGTNLVNGGSISGVTTTNLTISAVQSSDGGNYSVVVTNAYGSITSSVAALTVVIPPPPYTYTSNNGVITITGYTGAGGAVVIPAFINGLPVNSIGNYAFYGQSNVTSVTIPHGVTSIGYQVFQSCSSLISVTIPQSVTSMGNLAFYDCTSLASVTIDHGLTSIGIGLFDTCTSLTNVVIPGSVTNIGDWAFSGCSRLNGVTIPNSVTSIGIGAFGSCSSLTNITIPDSVSSVGHQTFMNCSSLTAITIPDLVTSISQNAFNSCTSLSSIVIGHSVTNIGDNAFGDCLSLTNVTIPDSVNSIEHHAFYGCLSLTNVAIGNAVREIGYQAFRSCTSLTSITIPNSVTSLGHHAFYDCTSLASVTIGNSLTSIGDNVFESCTSLTSVAIPGSVTNIGNWTFSGCRSLNGVTIPNSVKSIGIGAFDTCSSLISITIPDSVTDVGEQAFMNCSSLTNVTIGSGVISIGESAFQHCSNLSGVAIPASVTNIGVWAFFDCSSLGSILVNALNPAYSSSWDGVLFNKSQTTLIQFPGGKPGSYTVSSSVTNIGLGAFAACSKLLAISVEEANSLYTGTDGVLFNKNKSTIIAYPGGKAGAYAIPANVTSIAFGAFAFCGNLTGITIPDSVTSIGVYAFYDCTGLTNVILPNHVTGLGEGAFSACTNLTSITLPNSLTNISSDAFESCTSLTNITIPNSVSSLGSSAFQRCSSLTSITIPNSVTSIGYEAFDSCTNLTRVYFQGNAPSLGLDAFYNAYPTVYYLPGTTGWGATFGGRPTVLWVEIVPFTYTTTNGTITITGYTGSGGDVAIPGTITGMPVTSIRSWSFQNKTNLTSLAVPNSVTNIAGGAFSGCSSLASVTLGNSVVSIGHWAFADCTKLTTITIPDSVTFIGLGTEWAGAFRGCIQLTNITVTALNPVYSSSAGVLFNQSQTTLIQYPEGRGGDYTVPNTVTSIGPEAFVFCAGLTEVIIPDSVTSLGAYAFYDCTNLTEIKFQGNAPWLAWSVFDGADNSTVYYLPGTTGWGATFGGRPTALWFQPNPAILNNNAVFGLKTNQFGFTISWATNVQLVVEGSTNLINWSPLQTNTISGGTSYFSDSNTTNHPARFYRLRSP